MRTSLGEFLSNVISVLLGAALFSLLAYGLLKILLTLLLALHGETG
jgi:hypothetical protein